MEDLLRRMPEAETRLRHVRVRPAAEAAVSAWPAWAPDAVIAEFAARGVTHLWGHQAEAADLAWSGRHLILATGTASGKSLGYQLPALAAVHAGRGGSSIQGHREPTVLYVAPTKALAADQASALPSVEGRVRAATVDGDNTREERAWARDHANWVLTNPDTLHHVLLPGHARWARFWRGLRFVVLDECHHYRGVFGAHVAHIVRRLRRVAAHYGADPTFVLASATVADPEDSAARLTGLEVHAVTDDGSPHGPRTIALWEPPILDFGTGQARRPALLEAADLLADLVAAGVRTLCFVPSRRGAETVTLRAQRLLGEIDGSLVDRLATYRGGYLSEDRRSLERALRSGELLGLASTNALELGIDVSGLDAVISVGFPGTRAALWQQFGRAGRSGDPSLGVMVARDDPLDTYLVEHPDALLGAPVEATVFDPQNPYVLGPHLAAAAQEIALREEDLTLFGPQARAGVEALTGAGWLRARPNGWFWTRRDRASSLADLRSSGGTPVQIAEAATGRLLGTVDASSADATVHEGAVYVHQGERFLVTGYDREVALVETQPPDYSTQARTVTEVTLVESERQADWGAAQVAFGTVDVSRQVVSFARRSETGQLLGEEPLDLPEQTLRTKAVWWTLDDDAVEQVLAATEVPGSAHGAEHAAIGLLPLLAVCDRWDIGGLSTARHRDTGLMTIIVYDGHPGGAGFTERGFAMARHWLTVTRDAIVACECATGCPSCVQSPKCGNGNEPLDKAGAVRLLEALLTDAR